MKIYWFFEKGSGEYWKVIAAKDEKEAWDILSLSTPDKKCQSDEKKSVLELKEERDFFETNIDEKSGIIATIFPLGLSFHIEEEPK